MLNPAWQPAQEHAERLIHISHHFLSDNATPSLAKPPQAAVADAMQLPVLLAVDPDLPERQDPGYLLRALTRQLNLPDSMSARSQRDWHLQACAHPGELSQCGFTLLMIDATLDMTRAAYGLLKQLDRTQVETVGVIFRAGDDLAAARRCYRRLAVGALRFLNIPLVNLGWLPNTGPHFAAALAHAAHVIQSQSNEPVQQEPARDEVMQ